MVKIYTLRNMVRKQSIDSDFLSITDLFLPLICDTFQPKTNFLGQQKCYFEQLQLQLYKLRNIN